MATVVRLGPTEVPRGHRLNWTPAELHVLRAHYGRIPASALAPAFGRSRMAVCNKAFRLGLDGRGMAHGKGRWWGRMIHDE
jgi:hypothetical protein